VPFYDYVCETCGHEMEVMHSVHGHGPATCPKCGGPMKKAITAPAVHFKGSGWARKEKAGKAVRPSDDKKSSGSEPPAPAPSTSTDSSGSTAD
jgi:putative FmdB family regulatory protein